MKFRRGAWIAATLAVAAAWLPRGAPGVDYEPISLACLAAASDAIVLGRVGRDAAGAHWIEVKRIVAGERLEGRLRFETSPWQGEGRLPPSGEALLFLRRTAPGKALEVVGPSAEGWLPVERGFVRTIGIRVSDAPDDSQQLTLLLQALRGLAKCVRWDRTVGRGRVRATILCKAEILEFNGRRSAVEQALIADAKRATTAEGIPCLAIASTPRSR